MAYPTPTKKSTSTGSVVSGPATPKKPASSGGSLGKGIFTLVIVLLVIVGGASLLKGQLKFNTKGAQFTGEWQAVFLTNGQVYFGKIDDQDERNVYLENIYYLQVVNQPLQGTQDVGEVDTGAEPEQRLTLVKLGNELHGPKDAMVINRDHVILLEDLRDDSRVAQAIQDYIVNQQAE